MPLAAEVMLMNQGFPSLSAAPAVDPLEALVLQVRSGDLAAFEALVTHTEARLLALAWRLLGDRHLAQDAAQEAYLRAFRSLHTYRLGASFEAWLTRITVHACFDLARKRGPRPVAVDSLDHQGLLATPPEAEASVLHQQRRALVQQALATLPQAERAALVLRDLEGHSTEETARILGVRPVTVRSQAASARAKVQAFCQLALTRPQGGHP